ncbi:Pyridoxal-phosphate-dependent serine hydroxymethyltransferase [Gossypium australe]|uniref:Pyridoxal-phosphate-dependent serine hydroxymethyltransferase n=1 Tax=Gossypium australe TaxID=47621 RepID=A0A5B6WIJ8_9ROSI|nr:Pyridoxal-phosphate-dependent serine hydroxymethyltransferase [Gossypium australe]
MNYYTPIQQLRGAISLLRDKAYQWWLTVEQGTQSELITWDYFKSAFQGKYVRGSYIEARRCEFINLVQEERSVAEYKAEFLRLVVTENDKAVQFEDRLRYDLYVLIDLIDKVKIVEEVKRTEHERKD